MCCALHVSNMRSGHVAICQKLKAEKMLKWSESDDAYCFVVSMKIKIGSLKLIPSNQSAGLALFLTVKTVANNL